VLLPRLDHHVVVLGNQAMRGAHTIGDGRAQRAEQLGQNRLLALERARPARGSGDDQRKSSPSLDERARVALRQLGEDPLQQFLVLAVFMRCLHERTGLHKLE